MYLSRKLHTAGKYVIGYSIQPAHLRWARSHHSPGTASAAGRRRRARTPRALRAGSRQACVSARGRRVGGWLNPAATGPGLAARRQAGKQAGCTRRHGGEEAGGRLRPTTHTCNQQMQPQRRRCGALHAAPAAVLGPPLRRRPVTRLHAPRPALCAAGGSLARRVGSTLCARSLP